MLASLHTPSQGTHGFTKLLLCVVSGFLWSDCPTAHYVGSPGASWLLPFSLSGSESPLPRQGTWNSEGHPHIHSGMDGMYIPTSVPGHRPPGVSITAEVTVLGEHSLLALVVGKEAA